MGDQARRSHKDESHHDGGFWNHSPFQAGRNGSSWIRDVHDHHFNGPVTFIGGILEQNLGALSPDLVALLHLRVHLCPYPLVRVQDLL